MIASNLESPLGTTLDEQLCFALYAASRAYTGCYRTGLDEVGLTYPQYLVLMVLWQHRSVSVSELSERLQLSTGTLSPLLKRLETAGLLIRRRRTDDERLLQLTITPAGLAMRDRTESLRQGTQRTLLSAMTLDEVIELHGRLLAMARQLRAVGHFVEPA